MDSIDWAIASKPELAFIFVGTLISVFGHNKSYQELIIYPQMNIWFYYDK